MILMELKCLLNLELLKKKAIINALKNQDIIILDVISTYYTNDNLEIGFYGVRNNLTNSLPYLKQVTK
jgi:hypothetical protein